MKLNLKIDSRYSAGTTARLLVAALIVVGLGNAPARASAQTDGPAYVVQAGDSLYSIAAAFGTSVEALQQTNDIVDPSLLSVGQTLIIPGFEGVTGTLTTHRLALGETLPGLAKRIGATVETVIRLNRLINLDLLYVGQPLIYPEGGSGMANGVTAVAGSREPAAALAARSGQTIWELALLNDLANPYAVYGGQPIILKADQPELTGLPQPFDSLALKPDRPAQGRTLEVVARTAEGVALSGQFGERPLRFGANGSEQIALQGIDAFSDPGLYPLVITATTPSGKATVFEQMVPVADGNYPHQQLIVGAAQSALLDPDVTGPERDQVQQIASGYSPQRQWQGSWIRPVQTDRITTGFGWRRSYNGGPYDSYHDGIDFGAGGGSPIVAPAAGTVVFAEPLTVRGNATILDHGWGVYTGYWHQFKISVTVGQQVQAGDLIGEVGSSGLSTGSHLHFTVWVGGSPVDPEQWFTTEFP